MASPLWKYPGVLEGRLAPTQGPYYGYDAGDFLYYYAVDDWYYAGLETYGEGHAFCLGDDQTTLPKHRFQIGDAISVEQEFDFSAHKLLRFGWYMRQPENMLFTDKVIVQNGVVTFVTDGLIATGDGLSGFIVDTPLNQLAAEDAEQMFYIVGASDITNNGYFRSSGIPFNQGDVDGGDRVLLENAALAARVNDTGVTITRKGLKWICRAYMDSGSGWEERVVLEEEPNHSVFRNELAFHISKWTGTAKIKFEMKLEVA
jgi:hypothetical protein